MARRTPTRTAQRASPPSAPTTPGSGSRTTPPADSPASLDDPQMVSCESPKRPAARFPGFRRGNLTEITMKNFVTFEHCVLRPGPRMNVILGPNGAGKSTVASAVCIVFGGKPTILGRNPDLGAYVRYGAAEASITAKIFDPQLRAQGRAVTRVFDTQGRGYFMIDGRRARLADVQSKVNDVYDIQLDNLSQFMPQEKITEFVNCGPTELLAITVRSLGGIAKESEYNKLLSWDEKASKEENSLTGLTQQIEKLEEQQRDAAGEVAAFQEQERVMNRAELLTKLLPRLEYELLKKDLAAQIDNREELAEHIQDLKQQMAAASTGALNACRQQQEAAAATVRGLKDACKRDNNELLQHTEKLESVVIEAGSRETELGEIDKRALRYQRAIQDAEAKHSEAVENLSRHGDTKEHILAKKENELSARRTEIRNEIQEVASQRLPIEEDIERVSRNIKRHNHELQRVGSVRENRIRALSNNERHRLIPEVDKLIQEMTYAKALRGRVYGPVAAEIEVQGDYYKRIMEHSVRGWMSTAFVAELPEDSRLLLSECRRRFNGWVPDMMTAPTTSDGRPDLRGMEAQRPHRPVDQRLHRLGIEAVVSEIYTAPPAVKAALNAQASLHNVHVGNERVDSDEIECELRREEGLYSWYTPTRRVSTTSSRFHSGPKNLSIDYEFENISGNLFAGSMDSADRERARLHGFIRQDEQTLDQANRRDAELKGRLEGLKKDLIETQTELRSVTEQRNARQKSKDEVAMLKAHVETVKRRASSLNIAREKATLSQKLDDLNSRSRELALSSSKSIVLLKASMARYSDALAALVQVNDRLEREEAKHSSARVEIKEKEKDLQQWEAAVAQKMRECKEKKAEAKMKLNRTDLARHAKLLEEYLEKYAQNLEGLMTEIAELEGRAQGLTTGGRRVLEQYQHRQQQLNRLNEDLNRMRRDQDEKLAQLRQRKTAFVEWLRVGVSKMRSKFSDLYTRLGCSGDLDLINTESERLSDLALQILVSYREDVQLRPISASANSGGEKMCCTMLFCFSLLLEEERMPPFVFVDELNQGLDPDNEMKIMSIMFKDAEKETAPQSFVITPKLLLNLPFHSRTKTHVIFNGSVSKNRDIAAPVTS